MPPSGSSFPDDIRTIREKHGVAREEIHERTKISLENIQRFERGELDRHPHFNDVYLRALVRAYAEALGISEEVALQGLERSRAGSYEGELARAYLDRGDDADGEAGADEDGSSGRSGGSGDASEEPPEADADVSRSSSTTTAGDETRTADRAGEQPSEGAERSPEEKYAEPEEEDVPIPSVGGSPLEFGEEASEVGPGGQEDGEERHPLERDPDEFDDREESGEEAPSESEADRVFGAGGETGRREGEAPGEAGPAGSRRGASPGRTGSGRAGRRSRSSTNLGRLGGRRLPGRIALGGGILVLLAALVWVGITLFTGSEDPEPEEAAPPPAAVDTARSQPVVANPAPSVPEIGDSLELTVVADTDVLEPVRVRLDGGPWNPYWLEQGDSMRFAAVDSVELRSYLPRARVLVEGMDWPLAVTSAADSVLITREAVEQRIDSMAAGTSGGPGGPEPAEPDDAPGQP